MRWGTGCLVARLGQVCSKLCSEYAVGAPWHYQSAGVWRGQSTATIVASSQSSSQAIGVFYDPHSSFPSEFISFCPDWLLFHHHRWSHTTREYIEVPAPTESVEATLRVVLNALSRVGWPSDALRALGAYVGLQGALQAASTTGSAQPQLLPFEHPLAQYEVLKVMQDLWTRNGCESRRSAERKTRVSKQIGQYRSCVPIESCRVSLTSDEGVRLIGVASLGEGSDLGSCDHVVMSHTTFQCADFVSDSRLLMHFRDGKTLGYANLVLFHLPRVFW
jgi:hypothetical protein